MTVRIGFIGTGGIAVQHLMRLMHIPRAEVVALSDLRAVQTATAKEKVNQYAKEQNLDRVLDAREYTDYRAMLRTESLDAVWICVPQFARGEPESAVLDAGLHFLVEKPVGLNLATPDATLRKIDRTERVVSVGYLLRYMSTIQRMKELAASETVGMAVVMRFGTVPDITWYHRQDLSGGQLIDQATHQIDLLRYVLGEVRTVYAASALRINHKYNPEYDIFDVNCMTLTFESGAVANVANNMIARFGVPAGSRGIHIFCENVTLSKAGGWREPLQIFTADGQSEEQETVDPMLAQAQAFIDAVEHGDPSLVLSDFLSGIRTLAVTIAGDKSARTGRPVNVMELIQEEAPYAYSVISKQHG